ncbi:MAG TPA: peptidoglycan-associated lipoprotein Pal [Candidatus Eisenbacteria bacterium]
MRPNGRTSTLVFSGLLLTLVLSAGCASRKQVTTAEPAPPPPPPAESKTETPPPPPTPPSEKPKLTIQDAFFDFDDFSLRTDAKAALDNNAKYLEANSDTKVVIEGHCDERGSVEYNLALGEKRARAAKDYLVSYGIVSGRMTTISYGKERPFDPGHDEDAWAKNRRAHFVTK